MILTFCGGLGDSLILSSISTVLPTKMYIPSWQVPLINRVERVTALPMESRKEPAINFQGIFSGLRCLRDAEYYSLVERQLTKEVSLPVLDFDRKPDFKVYIHSTATCKNRCWGQWDDLANELSKDFEVVFLGKPTDYCPKGFRHLGKESSDIVWQTSQLANGYFIGIDSGFCHIAGCLGIPGTVIFSNSKPENVIARYPSLNSATPGNFHPSMLCGIVCEKAIEYQKQVKPEQVIKQFHLALKNSRQPV